MDEKTKEKNHDIYVLIAIGIYLLGFVFLAFVGNDYTGVMSFLAPAAILGGAIFLAVSLIF
jgi:small-conductance mechanosensitive channel